MKEQKKSNVRNVLLKIQDEFSTKEAKYKLMQFYRETRLLKNKDAGAELRGELSEIYLQLCVREFVKNNPNTFYIKGLTLNKKVGRAGFTELDLTLFTPKCVYLFESKSYSIKTFIEDKCLLVAERRMSYNVYGQSEMHLKNLKYYINNARVHNREDLHPYKIVLFSLTDYEVIDKRDDKWKETIPFLDKNNIDKYMLDKCNVKDIKKSDVLWDINKLYYIVSRLKSLSDNNFNKHIKSMKLKKK